MSDTSAGDSQVHSDDNLRHALSPKDELVHLLRGMEETSKQARSILFALTTTSAFVVVAALSKSPSGSIKLPIVGNEVPTNQFFFWSPLVILVIYLYLQIYIQELTGRFDRLYEFQDKTLLSPSIPRDLLFPWLFVIALESRKRRREAASGNPFSSADQFARTAQIIASPVPYIYPLAIAIIWLLGPFAQAILLLAFLKEERAVAIVPCFAFLVASWVAIGFLRPARSRIESSAWFALGVGLLMVTVASVPEPREWKYLATLWKLAQTLVGLTRVLLLSLVIKTLAMVLPVALIVVIGRLVYFRLLPLSAYRRRIAVALERELLTSGSLRDSFIALRGHLRSQPGVEIEAAGLIDQARTALILGPAGSGKTTILKYMGLKFATERQPHGTFVPVFLRLFRQGGSLGALVELAIATLSEYGVPNPTRYFHALASQGRIVFLLDGLDEIASVDRSGAVEGIRSLAAAFPDCPMYITSRPSGYHGELDQVLQEVLTLSPLSASESERFLRQRFGADSAAADQLIQQLKAINLPELSQNPLLLAWVTDIFNRDRVFPRSKTALIEELVQSRLSDWDRARGISSFFSLGQKLSFLGELARIMDSRGVHDMAQSDVLEIARSVAPELDSGNRAHELLAETLRSGLIVENAQKRIAFVHRSIQEYSLAWLIALREST